MAQGQVFSSKPLPRHESEQTLVQVPTSEDSWDNKRLDLSQSARWADIVRLIILVVVGCYIFEDQRDMKATKVQLSVLKAKVIVLEHQIKTEIRSLRRIFKVSSCI